MLVIYDVDPAEVIPYLWALPSSPQMKRAQWEAFCDRRGLLAFAAERDGTLTGLAVAESHPRALHILNLEGDADACRLLLARLVKLAGERDVSARCPVARGELQEMLQEWGFEQSGQDTFQGRPSFLYHWRNQGGG